MRIVSYQKVSALDDLLKDLREPQNHFIVPSRRDREWWRVRVDSVEFGLRMKNTAPLWNWEDLYEDLCAFFEVRTLRQIDPPDHRLILAHIVKSYLHTRPDLLKTWPGLARPGFIDLISDDIRELINEDVSPDQLEAATLDDKATSRVLPALYRAYITYLAENGLMDSAQIPLAARELLQSGAHTWANDKRFVFTGFMSFTHGQLHFVRTLEKQGAEIIVLQPTAELEGFQDIKRQFEEALTEQPTPSRGRIVSLCASDFSLEPELVARTLALWHAGQGLPSLVNEPFPGFGAIGMMVPKRRLASMEAALRRYRIPYSLARGRGLDQTLFGKTLDAVWSAWSQGLESLETALALAQPCLAGFNFSIDDAVKSGPRGVKGWENHLAFCESDTTTREERASAKRAVKAFKALTKFCRSLDKGDTPAGLLTALEGFLSVRGLWMDALADLSANSPDLDESLRETSLSVVEVETKRLALRELQPDLGDAGNVVLKGKEAFNFLKSWSEDTLIQPAPPTAGTLTLHSEPPPILASYPLWIVTDLTQKNWPGVIRSSPLLDVAERDAIKAFSAYLPSVHDKRVQKEALFRRMLQTGEYLTLVSRSATDEEGRPVGTTTFLPTYMSDMKLWTLTEPPIMGMADLLPGNGGGYFPAIEASGGDAKDRTIPRLREETPKLRLAVSDLYDLLDCPLRYWLRRNAKLRERDRKLWNEAEAGQLAHKLWENVLRRNEEEAFSLPLLVREEWAKALTAEGDYSPFARLLKDRRLERRRRYLEFYLERLADLQDRIGLNLKERGFKRSRLSLEEALSCETDGVVFSGRCDRLELFEERYAVILDYKTGKGASYEKKLPDLSLRTYLDTPHEAFRYGLQLSAYALLYASAHPEHTVTGVGFLGHGDGELAGTFDFPLADCYVPSVKKVSATESRMALRMDEAREAFRCAASILKNGRYEPCYVSQSCTYCDMKGICRKGELRGESLGAPPDEMEDADERTED